MCFHTTNILLTVLSRVAVWVYCYSSYMLMMLSHCLGMCKLYPDDWKLYMCVTSVTLRFQLTELLGQVGSLVTNMAA